MDLQVHWHVTPLADEETPKAVTKSISNKNIFFIFLFFSVDIIYLNQKVIPSNLISFIK